MEEYLNLFNTESEYQTFIEGEYATPNVSYILETHSVYYKPYEGNEPDVPDTPSSTANLCDIAYWDGSKVKTISQDKWNSSLGTPVGVVVIPEGFAPDGKARMIGLKYVTSTGGQWCPSSGYTDTSLTNYTQVPTTDNAGNTSTGAVEYAYLPSDKFTGTVSYVDPGTQYSGTGSIMIPSPYITRDGKFEVNPEYYREILSGETNVNVLSDFNGLSNTEYLVGLGSDYAAANDCWNYKDSANSTTQWYLPAAGELGFLMPRFNAINAAIESVGGVAVGSSRGFWSSSEYSSNNAYYMSTSDGIINYGYKYYGRYLRAFACL